MKLRRFNETNEYNFDYEYVYQCFADLIESAKFNYEEAVKPEDNNTLFIVSDESFDSDEYSDGSVIWKKV